MQRTISKWQWLLSGVFLMGLMLVARSEPASDFLRWRTNQVDARFNGVKLRKVLRKISGASGWQIYLQPGEDRTVSTEFKNLPPRDAIRMILGGLNHSLTSPVNGPVRLLIYQTNAREATEQVMAGLGERPTAKDWLPNEVIVTLAPDSKESIEELAKKLGATIVGKIDKPPSFRLQFDSTEKADAARQSLEERDDMRVDYNYAVHQPDQTAGGEVSTPPFTLAPAAKNGVVIGLVDTGLQPVDEAMSRFLLPAISVAGPSNPDGSELPAHGSSMFQTIMQTLNAGSESSGVRVLPVDIYGPNATTTTFELTSGVLQALQAGANIINMSLGGDGDSRFLDSIIQQGRQQGRLFFAAAGNTPTSDFTYPAANPAVLAVTASDRRGNLAPYANYGQFVDLIAPGTSFIEYGGQTFRITGTSPATAVMSGLAASEFSRGANADQAEQRLRKNFNFMPGRVK